MMNLFRSINILRVSALAAFMLFACERLEASEPAARKELIKDANGNTEMAYHRSTGEEYIYKRPAALHWVGTLPKDYASYFKKTFRKTQLENLGIITGSTLILYAFDDQIIRGAKSIGRDVSIPGTSHQTSLIDERIHFGKQELGLQFNVPTDLNSSMYFLGDGWTHTSIALSFWTAGLITHDYRKLQTASELGECILATGIATQFLKHITGRESPFTTDVPRGTWRFFPNQRDYAAHVPNHDAFPSGHLATAMATVTVIADNYPEYHFIRPVGYTLMGLLGFAMLNNGVHWASDYPLGIALGYSFAKIAVAQGRSVKQEAAVGSNTNPHFRLKPIFYPALFHGGAGIGVRFAVNR